MFCKLYRTANNNMKIIQKGITRNKVKWNETPRGQTKKEKRKKRNKGEKQAGVTTNSDLLRLGKSPTQLTNISKAVCIFKTNISEPGFSNDTPFNVFFIFVLSLLCKRFFSFFKAAHIIYNIGKFGHPILIKLIIWLVDINFKVHICGFQLCWWLDLILDIHFNMHSKGLHLQYVWKNKSCTAIVTVKCWN